VALDAGGPDDIRGVCSLASEGPCGRLTVSFVVGAPRGLSAEICRRAIAVFLSTLTLPHEMAQVLLCEQIYPAFSISRGALHR